MPALTVRTIGPDEVELFTSFTDASPLGLKPPREAYLDGLGKWYRPEWSWVALRAGRVVARVAFSGPPDADRPYAMGSLEIGTGPERVATGLALVRAAYGRHFRPGRGPWGPDIGYVGVLPVHRGRGYAEDLLIEATRLLVEDGATEIGAMTDVGNRPMAAAFTRCGYAVVDRMLVHV